MKPKMVARDLKLSKLATVLDGKTQVCVRTVSNNPVSWMNHAWKIWGTFYVSSNTNLLSTSKQHIYLTFYLTVFCGVQLSLKFEIPVRLTLVHISFNCEPIGFDDFDFRFRKLDGFD